MQIQEYKYKIHKYTNTTCAIFLKSGLSKDIKTEYLVSHTQIHKYTNTNTQIQHMTKYQKDPTCGIFLKRGLLNGIKNYIPMCQNRKYTNTNTKYTNTAYDEVPERPNMWYISEKKIVQWYQKLYSLVSDAQIQIQNTQIHKYST